MNNKQLLNNIIICIWREWYIDFGKDWKINIWWIKNEFMIPGIMIFDKRYTKKEDIIKVLKNN